MQFVALLHDLITIDIEKAWEVLDSMIIVPVIHCGLALALTERGSAQLIVNETYAEGEAQLGVETDPFTNYQKRNGLCTGFLILRLFTQSSQAPDSRVPDNKTQCIPSE